MGSFSPSLSEKVGCELLLCFIHADVTPGGKKSDGFADAVCHLNSEGGVSLCVITQLLLSEGKTPFWHGLTFPCKLAQSVVELEMCLLGWQFLSVGPSLWCRLKYLNQKDVSLWHLRPTEDDSCWLLDFSPSSTSVLTLLGWNGMKFNINNPSTSHYIACRHICSLWKITILSYMTKPAS